MAVIVFVLGFFLLAFSESLLRHAVTLCTSFAQKRSVVQAVLEVENGISRYLLTISTINAGLGLATALVLWMLGIPNPLLWGVLAMTANYVPHVGAFLCMVVLFFVGAVSHESLGYGLLTAGAFVILTSAESYFITPLVLSRSLQLSPLAVLLAILFAGWLWGIAGGLMAAAVGGPEDHLRPLSPAPDLWPAAGRRAGAFAQLRERLRLDSGGAAGEHFCGGACRLSCRRHRTERSLVIDEQAARVRQILGKLEQVRRQGLTCFGSESHKFQLKRPLAAAKLAAFEKRHGIRLPGCYRAFLEHAGNGGAGPYYGIYQLDNWDDFVTWISDEALPADFLARPCPLRPGRNTQCTARDHADYQGTISLGSQGCAYVMLLVVTGEYAGRVVYADADGQPPYMVREHDFLAWYERWLDELLQGYDPAWFGYGPGGGEAEFFRILESAERDEEERVEATGAFSRLPQLSDDARRRIPLLCGHRLEGVRAAACGVIRKFKIEGCEDASRRSWTTRLPRFAARPCGP